MVNAPGGPIVPDQHNGSLPRHRHNLSREQVESSQSARIINAAIDLFGTNGYAATTVMDIVKRAGVSRKTFYEMFESKEAVVVAAYRAFDRFLRDAGVAAPGYGDQPVSAEMFGGLVRMQLTLLSYNPAAARLFFLEVLGAGDEVRRRRDAAISQFTQLITPQFQLLRARLDPDLPPLEASTVRLIVGGIVEMIARHLVYETAETLPDLADEIGRVVFAVVVPTVTYPGIGG